jgi:hypothetical protein
MRLSATRAGLRSGVALLAGPILLVAMLVSPASAQAVIIALAVTPQFPILVTVGQQNVGASLTITNDASVGVGPVTLSEITLNPACGSLSLDCAPPDPGVFALSPTATGTSGVCTGRSFTILPPNANGRSLFLPVGSPVVLGTPGQATSSCGIAFTFSVLKAPTVDAQPAAAGLQTAHVATVTGSGASGGGLTGVGTARALQTSNVNRAQPTIATQASGPVPVGGTISDTATVSGPVALTGTITFSLYGPNNATCTGPAVFTSVKPVAANTATSNPFTTTQAGTYRFIATYSGDANNLGAAGPCGDPAETVLVGQDGGRYHPLTPARILDTRLGTGGINVPLGPGATVDLQITSQGGVPASGVSAVALSMVVTQPTGDGYLTVYPAGGTRPTVSNLNFTPGDTVPNLVVVKLGANGRVSIFNSTGDSHVIVDVAGWYDAAGSGNDGRYQALVPSRLVDTRLGDGGARLAPGAALEVQVSGAGGVPASGAQAAALNVTATNATATSFLTVYPSGELRPLASNLNVDAGETVANRVFAKLGANGRVTVFNSAGDTDVIVDVGGWFTDASVAGSTGTFTVLEPARIVDTRLGIGDIPGPVGGGTTTEVQVTGRGGIPASDVSAVILNVTAVSPSLGGYFTMYPSGPARPNASDLNFAPSETRANLVVVRLGTGGRVRLFTPVATHFIVDVAGWYS